MSFRLCPNNQLGKYEYEIKAPPMPQMFGNAGREHMAKYGTTAKHFAMIGEKNHRHSKNNPYAQFREEYSLEQIESAPMTYEPLTKLQCSPTSDGAGAAIVCSEEFVVKHGLQGQAVEIVGQAMKTDAPESFSTELHDRSCIDMVGAPMAKNCADEVYKQSGLSAEDVQVVELVSVFQASALPRMSNSWRVACCRRHPARLLFLQRAHHVRVARAVRRGRGR